MLHKNAQFEVDLSTFPPSCLPVGIKTYELIDITAIGDSWKRYMHPESGKIHDGAEYYKLSQM